jgi:uroporphyrinogen-III synthase
LRLLLTRPEPDAARSAAALRARGYEVVLAPLLRIEPVAGEVGRGPWAGVLITSAHALIGTAARSQDLMWLPLIAVGEHSAAAARAVGFAEVISAHGAMDELAALVRQRFTPGQRLLYLAGADRAGDLAEALAASGLTVETRVVYRAAAVTELPEPVRAELSAGRIDGVLHYSRRAAEAYLAAAAGLGAAALSQIHICLSARVAEPLVEAGARRIRVAAKPTEADLLQVIDSL